MSELTRNNIKLKKYPLVFVLILLSAASLAFGQGKNSSDSVKTSKGILKIEDDSKTIDGLQTPFKSLSFFVGAEAVSCIGQFFIVDVSDKKPLMTEKFGNCGNNPRITYRSQTLTVTFLPGKANDYYKAGNKEVWQYSNGKLKQVL